MMTFTEYNGIVFVYVFYIIKGVSLKWLATYTIAKTVLIL